MDGEGATIPREKCRLLERIVRETRRDTFSHARSYFWQVCATLVPLSTAPIGILANLSSIISLADRWRENAQGETIPDVAWLLVLNSLALACGCTSNVVLLLNFCHVLGHTLTQAISILFYMLATCIYMGMYAATSYAYFNHSQWYRTEGYWHGASAAILYTTAATMLAINLVGHISGQFDGEMYLNYRERYIYMLMTGFLVWIAMGGAVCQYKLDISYADACYFCVVSCMTLGFGDIVPEKNLIRGLMIPYIYVAVVMIAITVVLLYTMIAEHSKDISVHYRLTRRRHELFESLAAEAIDNDMQSYLAVRHLVRKEIKRANIRSHLLAFVWLAIFWLGGALVYHFTEGWTYFEAFYFCSIVMATVGYGDFTPKSPGGRTFFVQWMITAIPTMSTVTSNLGSGVLESIDGFRKRWRNRGKVPKRQHMQDRLNRIRKGLDSHNPERRATYAAEAIVLLLVHQDPAVNYPYEIWGFAIKQLLGPITPTFWLSDQSPLIHAIDERKCLMLICLHSLGKEHAADLEEIVQEDDTDNSDASDFASIVQEFSHETADTLTKPSPVTF